MLLLASAASSAVHVALAPPHRTLLRSRPPLLLDIQADLKAELQEDQLRVQLEAAKAAEAAEKVSWDYYESTDACMLPEAEFDQAEATNETLSERAVDAFLLTAPIVLPLLAALNFASIESNFHNILELFGSQLKWVQVDGGLSRTAALLPVMTGIVLPCVSFALGTLTATTISTLRARQVELRRELNQVRRSAARTAGVSGACADWQLSRPPWSVQEACMVRSVLSAAEAMFPAEYCQDERSKAALLLRQYCTRVLVESRSGIDLDELASRLVHRCQGPFPLRTAPHLRPWTV